MTSGSTTITFGHDVKSAVQAGLDTLLGRDRAQNGAARESRRARTAEIRAQFLELRDQINSDTSIGISESR